jgi:hypothetical protein
MGYGKGQPRQSAHTTVTYQFKEHIFPFIRSRKVTMVNFDAILHSQHFFTEKSISLLNVTRRTPSRQVDHMILQDHGNGVLRGQGDIHADMNIYRAGFHHP